MPNSSVEKPTTDLIPLSLLTQYGYCPRRCGLLAIDGLWAENEYTAEGRAAHERVHTARAEKHGDTVLLCEYPVFSREMGISGLCDCVELHASSEGVSVPFDGKTYTLYPVEYKHGTVRDEHEYHIQLCAQAMCLEEHFKTEIPRGAIFYINAHRRDEVELTESLRAETKRLAAQIHAMIASEQIPQAVYSAKCKKCSLAEDCQPKLKSSAVGYLESLWKKAGEEGDGEP